MSITSTYPSSTPMLIIDGFASGMPRTFLLATTYSTSDVSSTGWLKGVGAGSRGGDPLGVRLGDCVLHQQTTATSKPGFMSVHSVIATSANQASTTSSTGWNAAYDVTLSACT